MLAWPGFIEPRLSGECKSVMAAQVIDYNRYFGQVLHRKVFRNTTISKMEDIQHMLQRPRIEANNVLMAKSIRLCLGLDPQATRVEFFLKDVRG